jgi:hypothetical protein
MAFDEHGNAFDVIENTPDALEEKAREMRRASGELSSVTMEPCSFATIWVDGWCRRG